MKESPAWLLNIGNGKLVGAGERELLHLVEQPELFEVPLAPRHCRQILVWQGQLLPVWDMLAWLEPGSQVDQIPLVVIVGYQSRRGETPKFGALILSAPPVRTWVADTQGCQFPADQSALREIALSCFMFEGKEIPVIDLARMFTQIVTPPF